jgi:sarcosine oxidase gamma subunit
VPELRAVERSVVLCQASTEALDALVAPGHGSRSCRTAPDEVMIVADRGREADVEHEVADRIAAFDEDAIVLDVTDGWTAWSLTGGDAREAFAYLSSLELPADGFVQGDVARVPAKVLVEPDGLVLLVPSFWGAHLRERALTDARATEVAR